MQIGSKLQIGGAVLQLGLNSPTLTTVNGPLDAESVAEPYVPPFAIAAPVVDFVEPPRRKKRFLPIAIAFSALLLIGVVILAIPICKPLDSSVSSTPSGPTSSGRDSESLMVVCFNCNGSGRATCPSCGGSGRSGLRPGSRGEIMPQFINPSRGGSGYRGQLQESDSEIDSEVTHPSGYPEGFHLAQRFIGTCQECGGKGWVICPVCGGTGKVSLERQAEVNGQQQQQDQQNQLQQRRDQAELKGLQQQQSQRETFARLSELRSKLVQLRKDADEQRQRLQISDSDGAERGYNPNSNFNFNVNTRSAAETRLAAIEEEISKTEQEIANLEGQIGR